MYRRPILSLFTALICSVVGCKKPAAPQAAGTDPALAPETSVRLHWIGKRQLTLEGSAFYFNRLWDLPETQQLEARTLDALAVAPWRILHGQNSIAQAPVAPLRWIFESLKYEETFLEIRSVEATNMEFALAVRLSEKEAGAWRTNMAYVVNSLTGIAPLSSPNQKNGWKVIHPQLAFVVELTRERDWTLVGFARNQNRTLKSLAAHIRSSANPFGSAESKWLRLYIDASRFDTLLGSFFPGFTNFPTISLELSGDGGNVLTDATLTFPHATTANLDSWNLPADQIQAPLSSFVAVRGISDLLAGSKIWSSLKLGTTPGQLAVWSSGQTPFQVYAAVPVQDGAKRLDPLAQKLLSEVNPWLRNNGPKVGDSGVPMFERSNDQGLVWNIPGLRPFLRPLKSHAREHLWLGLTSEAPLGKPADLSKVSHLLKQTNAVLVEWEVTNHRIEALLPVLQTSRVLAHRPALPENSMSLAWLTAIRPRLDETQTTVTRTKPDRLHLHRKSSLGLDALELHLLADWLESPTFPAGLHTFTAPLPAAP